MNDPDRAARLTRCFEAVFPAAGAAAADWDSLGRAVLYAVVEEEFGVPFPPAGADPPGTFAAVLAALDRAGAGP